MDTLAHILRRLLSPFVGDANHESRIPDWTDSGKRSNERARMRTATAKYRS